MWAGLMAVDEVRWVFRLVKPDVTALGETASVWWPTGLGAVEGPQLHMTDWERLAVRFPACREMNLVPAGGC